MDFSQFHFAHPAWLWTLVAIPVLWTLLFLFFKSYSSTHQLEKFIDSHLLPYLLINKGIEKNSAWRGLLIWTIVWGSLSIALAGPRWSFQEREIYSQDQSLVLLLDLSDSMNVTDVKPSRLVRAKQKIEDILNNAKGVKIGLIAFAADPHMITPLTDDIETIRHLLPSLDTDLVYVQGSRLSAALEMASSMLESESGSNKAVLVITDGGFEDASAMTTAKKLAGNGIAVHIMGIGTPEGALLVTKKNPSSPLSKLETEKLIEISKVGNGYYLDMQHADQGEMNILSDLKNKASTQMQIGKTNRFWDERFYLFILPILPFLLRWYRRGYIIALFIMMAFPHEQHASDLSRYFMNSEELGKKALDAGDYETAIDTFQDPYRKGVACYQAGNYAEAEKMFRESSRAEIATEATYNLGNALALQMKLKEAIIAYEEVLQSHPDHIKAKENLEIIKKMLENQPPPENSKDSNSPNSNENDSEEPRDNESSEGKSGEDNKNSSKNREANGNSQGEPPQENRNDEDVAPENSESQKEKGEKGEQQKEDQPSPPSQEKAEEPPQQKEEQESTGEEQEKGEGEPEHEEEQESSAKDEEQESAAAESEAQEGAKGDMARSQEDQDADFWLNRISNDPKVFLKNKFQIESTSKGTKESIEPW